MIIGSSGYDWLLLWPEAKGACAAAYGLHEAA
jgi:hypothetical protein